jgi:hypothetical protein
MVVVTDSHVLVVGGEVRADEADACDDHGGGDIH